MVSCISALNAKFSQKKIGVNYYHVVHLNGKTPNKLHNQLLVVILVLTQRFLPHSRRPTLYRMKYILWNKVFYDIHFIAFTWPKCTGLFSGPVFWYIFKEGTSWIAPVRSPTIPYLEGESFLQGGSLVQDWKAARFSTKLNSQSIPTLPLQNQLPHTESHQCFC